jgi:hypothetical protein
LRLLKRARRIRQFFSFFDIAVLYLSRYDWKSNYDYQSHKVAVAPGSLVYSEVKKVGPSLFQMAVLASGVWVNATVAVPAYVAPLVMAYVVLEHQPALCSQFPPDNVFVFSQLQVRPNGGGGGWAAHDCAPACASSARVLGSASVALSWNSSATAPTRLAARMCAHPHARR